MRKVRRSKKDWSGAVGGFHKPRRLKLKFVETESVYRGPVKHCQHIGFRSKGGCRQHVYTHHSWYYYFHSKPSKHDAFPKDITTGDLCELPKKQYQKIPCFQRSIALSVALQKWWGGGGGGGGGVPGNHFRLQ